LKFYEHLGKLFRRAILFGGPGGQCNLWLYWELHLIKHLKNSIKFFIFYIWNLYFIIIIFN
jgi:hypothetical protein